MSNTLLTASAVTREALRVLHQKLRFVSSINRQYDKQFALEGAKIGDSLKIRLPNQYTVRSGATLATQDTAETHALLQIATQKGVDLNFTSVDLTLSLDAFSKRILEPAMAVLAASIEADALSMRKDVYQQVANIGQPASFAKVLEGRKRLVDSLTPDGARYALLSTQDNLDLVDALKGLFNNPASISRQFKDGVMGETAGFDFMESTHLGTHMPGARSGTPLVNGATADGAASLVTDGWSTSVSGLLRQGDVFTIAAVNAVHPETKVDTGVAQQFVMTADASSNGSGQATLAISPAIVASGARQNVTAVPADNAGLTFQGTASTAYGQSLVYHEDAFAFATADLVMPRGVDFAAREVFDGISIRVVRQYDINSDKFPCRLDVIYGFKTIRPQMAARLANH